MSVLTYVVSPDVDRGHPERTDHRRGGHFPAAPPSTRAAGLERYRGSYLRARPRRLHLLGMQ